MAETDREKPFHIVASAKEVVRLGRSPARDERLSAAALLRDIGYFVSHTAHHKHSAYLIQRWRLEERADLFKEVFGREVELVTTRTA